MPAAPLSRVQLTEPLGPEDHLRGPVDAPVQVVEYVDFECPGCKRAAPAVEMLLRHFDGRICVALRHFPLESVHPHALQAAEAAECAAAQGRFWEMAELLFADQLHLASESLSARAERLGLDMECFDAEMGSHAHVEVIRRYLASGTASGVRGTPGFFVNGMIHDVSFGLRGLFDRVEAEIARARS